MQADYTVKIDWNDDGDYADARDDVTSRVLDQRTPVTVRFGRDQARTMAPMAVGEAALELNNSSRDYSPENAASPLAGQVLPGRSVTVDATLSGVSYSIFVGQLDDFDVLPERDRRSVTLTCLDALARLKDVNVSTPLYAGVRSGEAIGLLLDAVGWPADLRDLDPGASVLPWWWADTTDAWAALNEIVDSEGPAALATVDAAGRVVFRDRHHRLLDTASKTVQATWRSGGVEPTFSAPLTYEHGWKEIVNSVSFDVPVRALSGQLAVVWSTQGQTSVADGQTVQVAARSSDPFAAAVAPVEDVDYQLLSGTVEITLSRTSGVSAIVSVKAVGGPATLANLQLRAYPLQTVTTVQVAAEEPVSIGRYGRRSAPSTRSPVWASVYDAEAIADLILGQRAERLPTLTVTFRGGNAARLTQQLSRDLSDRVHVVDTNTGLDDDFFVEQISHTITQGGAEHVTTFGLEKAPDTGGNLFTFNVAGKGFNDGVFAMVGRDDPAAIFTFDAGSGHRFDEGLFAY